MDIWTHSRLSAKKFGGEAEDYYEIHKFIDSSKLFYFHIKHRILLHNTFGIDICNQLFGDYIVNSSDKTILVRDISAEHIKEDLSGKVPTLNDWFEKNPELEKYVLEIPEIEDERLRSFIMTPFLQTGLRASLVITCSDFGVYLASKIFDISLIMELREQIPNIQNIKSMLRNFRFTSRWQYSPKMDELKLLK